MPVTGHERPWDREVHAYATDPATGFVLPVPIPRCGENRTENNARYCVSAYCDRCATLRAHDDVPALTPNAWMAYA